MSHLSDAQPFPRWRLRIAAGYQTEHDLIVDHDVLPIDELIGLLRDPSISSIQFDRYHGRQPTSLLHVSTAIGSRS